MYCDCRNENPYEKTRTRFTVGWILFTHGSIFNIILDIVSYQSRSGEYLLTADMKNKYFAQPKKLRGFPAR